MGKFKHFLSFGLIVILFFNSLSKLNAQETAGKFSIESVFGGVYSYRNLEVDQPHIIAMRDEMESPAYGYHGGLSIAYSLSDQWDVESGISYATRGYKSKGEGIDSEWNVVFTFETHHNYH